jgi:putative hydrolase of the HAD superfamily
VGAAVTATKAVLLDFYGTLGESDWSETWLVDLLAEHGHEIEDTAGPHALGEAYDGEEHDEHSVSAETYTAWLRARWTGLLASWSVPEDQHAALIASIETRRATWRMQLYPEVIDVLGALRDRGLQLVVCSNWDWDLDHQIEVAGLDEFVHGTVSSAWVGARKPHPRMFRAALDVAGVDAGEALFVGDNWTADVEGARAAGLRAVHVWRRPAPPEADLPDVPPGVHRVADLRALLDLV